MGRIYRNHWMQDKDREELIMVIEKTMHDLRFNINKFLEVSVLEENDTITVCIPKLTYLIRILEELRAATKILEVT